MPKTTTTTINAPLYDTTDILVVGGGPAGIAAAIAASRCGKRVILVEQTAQLGGMATSASVAIWMPIGNITGIYREINSELLPNALADSKAENYAPQFNPFHLRHYFNMKMQHENVKVIFRASFIAVIHDTTTNTNANTIIGIVINTPAGPRTINADVIIDCTGDARVAIDAGAKYTTGREPDHMTQPMTLMFQMQNTGKPTIQYLPDGCYRYEKLEDLPQGRRLYWERNEDGTLLVNMTRVKGNAAEIDDINNAEVEALKQVFSVANYLQRTGFENYVLSHIAPQTGARETNQIIGLYTLNEDDIFNAKCFDDVVAQTNYGIDIHSPDGGKTCDLRELSTYDIPYRCLIPKNAPSILVAGRAISTTHVVMSSMRVQPTCFALGQAAGVAAALSIDNNSTLADVPIDKLHTTLKKQGVEFHYNK